MSAHLIAVIGIVWLACSVIAFALLPRRARRQAPVRLVDVWDEDAGRWTVRPEWVAAAPAPVRAVIDLAPGIDLGLRDDCELLWAMPAYGATAADHTTSEGDLS